LQVDTGLSRAIGRKTSPKIIWFFRLGVGAAGHPPAYRKKKLAKKPIGKYHEAS
jgi:hypothetical protein